VIVLVLLSAPRFRRWALHQARRQSDRVVVVVNGFEVSELGDLEPWVTWLTGPPGKPDSLTVAGRWLLENAPGEVVVQHDQDDYYPEGSAATKLAALQGADIVGSPVRRVWFEDGPDSALRPYQLDDYWGAWGGSYAWRVDSFVDDSGASRLFDDVVWVDRMVRAGARFAPYDSSDTYCRWIGHGHVWGADKRQFTRWVRPEPAPLDAAIMAEAEACGALHRQLPAHLQTARRHRSSPRASLP
jgi:hypothetical protein